MAQLAVIPRKRGNTIICETAKSAVLEMIDLMDRGCDNVKCFWISGDDAWNAAHEIEDIIDDGRPFGRKGMARLESELNVTIKLHGLRAMTLIALS